jgi:peptide/nickel transport system substrate-binding protein
MNEQEVRQLIAAVKAGRVSRRTFVRSMVGLGLTAPLASRTKMRSCDGSDC